MLVWEQRHRWSHNSSCLPQITSTASSSVFIGVTGGLLQVKWFQWDSIGERAVLTWVSPVGRGEDVAVSSLPSTSSDIRRHIFTPCTTWEGRSYNEGNYEWKRCLNTMQTGRRNVSVYSKFKIRAYIIIVTLTHQVFRHVSFAHTHICPSVRQFIRRIVLYNLVKQMEHLECFGAYFEYVKHKHVCTWPLFLMCGMTH